MSDVRIRRLDGRAAVREAGRVWAVYHAVFDDQDDESAWREETFLTHAAREHYRLLLAESASELVGFAWGYRGERGQFWSDWVARELPEIAATWIGGHDELVEMAVLQSHRGQGVAGRLLDAYLADTDERTLLSTEPDAAAPAVRLYRSRGFDHLGMLTQEIQVMGRRRQG